MIYEVPPMFVYGFYLLFIVAIFAGIYVLNGWRYRRQVYDKETKSNKIRVGIWEADGFVHKYLVPKENDGKTVKVNGRTYFLPKTKESSPAEDAIASVAKDTEDVDAPEAQSRRGEAKQLATAFGLAKYPEGGFGPKVVLRYVEYDEGNPEPRRSFYGMWIKEEKGQYIRCDPGEGGAIFIQNQLVVTQSELDSYKDQIQAIAIAERLKELDAMQKTFQRALANIPNKAFLYIGIALAVLAPFIAGMLGY